MNRKDLMQKSASLLLKRYWPILGILFLALIFFYPVWLQNKVPLPADLVVGTYYPWLDYKWGYAVGVPVKNPITTDVVSFSYPMRTLTIDLLKNGQVPLWNPYILTGIPLLANFQSAPFTITNIFYFLVDTLSAWSLQVIVQHILAALFTYLLLRRWSLSKKASLIGGAIFAYSGFNLIWSQWNAHALAAAFIPFLLLFMDKWIKKGAIHSGALISLGIAFQILSGYPQILLYTFFALITYWIITFEKKKEYLRRSFKLVLFILLGVGLASFQIIPSLELFSLSQRAIEPLEFSGAFLPWIKIITFIAPDYFGNHATYNYWGPGDYTTTTGYVGVVSVILATFTIALFKKNKQIKYAFILLIVSLLLAFPTPLSIFIWKSGILGLQAASAHRSLVLFTFAASILSAFGFEKLSALTKEKIRFKFLLAPLIILIPYVLYSVFSLYLPSFTENMGFRSLERWKVLVSLRNLILPAFLYIVAVLIIYSYKWRFFSKNVLTASIVTLLIFELFRFGWKFTPFSYRNLVYPTTPVLDFLMKEKEPFRTTASDVVPINIRMPYGLESPEGYDAIYPVDIAQFIASLNSELAEATPQGRYGTVSNETSRLLNLINTKYLLALKTDENNRPSVSGKIPKKYLSENYKLVFEDRTTVVLENANVLPRAFMVYEWEVERDRKEILRKLLEKDYPYSKKVLLEDELEINTTFGSSTVKYSSYGEQNDSLDVATQTDGLLFVSDLFYPGWKVKIDGQEGRILRANYAFRAVFIPAGDHKVEFIYDPLSFRIGKWITVSTGVLLTGIYLHGQKSKKRKQITRKRPF